MEIIADILLTGDNSSSPLNILEFGPTLSESRCNLAPIAFKQKHNYYCIDLINYDSKNTTVSETHNTEEYNYITKYNINCELKSYTALFRNPTLFKEFKTLKPNFYDVIFTKYSISESMTFEGVMKVADIVGKKNCKIILIPWMNTKSKKEYEEIICNLNLPKGWSICHLDNTNFLKKLNKQSRVIKSGYKKTVAFTKNISHDRFNI